MAAAKNASLAKSADLKAPAFLEIQTPRTKCMDNLHFNTAMLGLEIKDSLILKSCLLKQRKNKTNSH